MSWLGYRSIDDVLTFTASTHSASTGAATDADSVPSYRVYEDETGTAILSGSMAKLDDANTTGFYSEQITLSAANGFEAGRCYSIYISAAVSSVTGTTERHFSIWPASIGMRVDANVVQISGDSAAADNLEAAADGTGYNLGGGSVVAASVTGAVGSVTGAVGSVTGNVGGNVVGSVASVTGAVGSVTGNVGGNVVGSVGSVAAGGITAASIATDAIDADALASDAVTEIAAGISIPSAASIADAVWDEAVSGHVTADTFGERVVLTDGTNGNQVKVTGAGHIAADVHEFQADVLTSAATASSFVNELADAVWDEALSGHATAGTAGAALSAATAPTASAIADAVWDELLSGHLTAGSAGDALSSAGSGGIGLNADQITGLKRMITAIVGVGGETATPGVLEFDMIGDTTTLRITQSTDGNDRLAVTEV